MDRRNFLKSALAAAAILPAFGAAAFDRRPASNTRTHGRRSLDCRDWWFSSRSALRGIFSLAPWILFRGSGHSLWPRDGDPTSQRELDTGKGNMGCVYALHGVSAPFPLADLNV